MPALEYPVKRILGHSLREDAEGIHDVQYLIEWEGVDENGIPYPHSWQDFVNVGIPLIADYTHRLAMSYPRLAHQKPDGYTYLYVDETALEHVPRASIFFETPKRPSPVTAYESVKEFKDLFETTQPAIDKAKKPMTGKAYSPKKSWDPRKPSGVKPRKGRAVVTKKSHST